MSMIELILSNPYFKSFTIFAMFVVGATAVHFFMKKYGERLIERLKNENSGAVLHGLATPTYITLLFTGAYLAFKELPILASTAALADKVAFVVYVFLASYLITKVSSLLTNRWLKVTKRYEQTPQLISKIVAIIVYIIAILVILDHFEIEITPLIATLGVGGIALGLALQDTLKDFVAGVHIISDQPIRVGDFIEINGTDISGYVQDIGWRSTRIKTLPNNIVILPNSKLATSTIMNSAMPQREMSTLVQVGVDYTSDLAKVEKVTIRAAKKIQKSVEGAVEDFEPFIRYHTFADSNINFTVILRVKDYVSKYLVTHEFVKALHKEYKKEGIEISWPIRKLYDMPVEKPKKKGKK